MKGRCQFAFVWSCAYNVFNSDPYFYDDLLYYNYSLIVTCLRNMLDSIHAALGSLASQENGLPRGKTNAVSFFTCWKIWTLGNKSRRICMGFFSFVSFFRIVYPGFGVAILSNSYSNIGSTYRENHIVTDSVGKDAETKSSLVVR